MISKISCQNKIENVHIGDSVYSYNFISKKLESMPVVTTFSKDATAYFEIITDKNLDVILVTSEHPFFVKDKGWIKAKDLSPKDLFYTKNGNYLGVHEINQINGNIKVYNIEVASNHNYFVSNSEILVHNKSIPILDLIRLVKNTVVR